MDNYNNNEYFAAVPTEDIGDRLIQKTEDYYDYIWRNGWVTLWQKSYSQYYKGYHTNGDVTPYGELGEKRILSVNHFRNILEHIKVLTTSDRPVFEPRAINDDYKSHVQTKFARVLLDYYMTQEGLEDVIDSAMDFAVFGGEAFIMEEWDKHAGDVVGEDEPEEEEEVEEQSENDEETPMPEIKREGNVKTRSFHPIDVVRDWDTDTSEDNHWYIVRKRINKFELAAKYPKRNEEILAAGTDDNTKISQRTLDLHDNKRFAEGDQIFTYIFRHEKNEPHH